MRRLSGKCVWLTGASSGIGEALTYELVRRGANVAASARRAEALEGVCDRANRIRVDSALAFPLDVTDINSVNSTASQIEAKLGQVQVLIANAGTCIYTYPERFDSREYMQLMKLNFGGVLNCMEAVIPAMIERKDGHIVGVASLAGYRGLPRSAGYGASKAALQHFLESLRFQLLNYNIDITVINPGFIKTPLTDRNDFRMVFVRSADYAARRICDGIERGAREVAFPPLFALFLKLLRMSPASIYESAVKAIDAWSRKNK